jgi:hypothetical protein
LIRHFATLSFRLRFHFDARHAQLLSDAPRFSFRLPAAAIFDFRQLFTPLPPAPPRFAITPRHYFLRLPTFSACHFASRFSPFHFRYAITLMIRHSFAIFATASPGHYAYAFRQTLRHIAIEPLRRMIDISPPPAAIQI